MGHHSCCNQQKVKRGLWSPEEDEKLITYIRNNAGYGCWSEVPEKAGLQRCGKSCRLRWINYLRPDIRRGKFSPEEERLIIKLHSIVGNRWAHIATHLPGRTDNEIKNYWNSWIKKKLAKSGIDPKNSTDQVTTIEMSNILSEPVDMLQEDPSMYVSSYINAASSQTQLYAAAGDLPHAVSNLAAQDSKVLEFLQDYNIFSNANFANASAARSSADRDDKSAYNMYNNGSRRAADRHDGPNLCSVVQEKLAADAELAPEWSSDNMYLISCEPALLEYGNGDHIGTASRVKNQIVYNDDFQLIKGLQIADRNANHNSNGYSSGDLLIGPGILANSINTSYETTAASVNLDIYEPGRGLSAVSPFPTDSVDVNQHDYGSCCAAYNLPQLLESCEEWADADMKFGSNSAISNADGASGFSDANRLRVGNSNNLSLQSSCSTEDGQVFQIPINMNRKNRRDLPLESAVAGNSVERPAESCSTAMSTLQWYESPAHSLFFNSEQAAAQRMFDPLGAIDQSLAITSDQSVSASGGYNINGRPSDDVYKNSQR